MPEEPLPQPTIPAAILWDMDGTLVDTEPYWGEEETAMIERAGGTWTEQQALALVGSDLMVAARTILETTPVSGNPEDFVAELVERVAARMRVALPWRPGAAELLAQARDAGVRCALVTMSWTPLAEVLLAALPPGTFDAVVTGDSVTNGKPHPEPYLTAARELGLQPCDCVAIEDSPTGVRSATAAGVPTIGVPNVVAIPQLPGLVLQPTLAGVDLQRLAELAQCARTGSVAR